MTMPAFTFQPRYHRVTAVQYVGADSVPVIQAFLSPLSPYYTPAHEGYDNRPELQVPVFDAMGLIQYPSLGRRYKMQPVPLNGWVIKLENNDLAVLTNEEMADRYEEVPVSMQSAMRALGVAFSDPVVGDDVDSTGVVPGVPVFADSEAEAMAREIVIEDPIMIERPVQHAEAEASPVDRDPLDTII